MIPNVHEEYVFAFVFGCLASISALLPGLVESPVAKKCFRFATYPLLALIAGSLIADPWILPPPREYYCGEVETISADGVMVVHASIIGRGETSKLLEIPVQDRLVEYRRYPAYDPPTHMKLQGQANLLVSYHGWSRPFYHLVQYLPE